MNDRDQREARLRELSALQKDRPLSAAELYEIAAHFHALGNAAKAQQAEAAASKLAAAPPAFDFSTASPAVSPADRAPTAAQHRIRELLAEAEQAQTLGDSRRADRLLASARRLHATKQKNIFQRDVGCGSFTVVMLLLFVSLRAVSEDGIRLSHWWPTTADPPKKVERRRLTPAELAVPYDEWARCMTLNTAKACSELGPLLTEASAAPSLTRDSAWRVRVAEQLVILRGLARETRGREDVPAAWQSTHQRMRREADDLDRVVELVTRGIDHRDDSAFGELLPVLRRMIRRGEAIAEDLE